MMWGLGLGGERESGGKREYENGRGVARENADENEKDAETTEG
jgi:hypothetical protein